MYFTPLNRNYVYDFVGYGDGLTAVIPALSSIWREWTHGISVSGKGQILRIAPMRLLELPAMRDAWRSGDTMRAAVHERKTAIYAIHRRVHGLPRFDGDECHEPMTVDAAFQQLQGLLSGKQGISFLVKTALSARTSPHKEFTPDAYEKYVEANRGSTYLYLQGY